MLLIHDLGVEADADAHTAVGLNALSSSRGILVRVLCVAVLAAGSLALDDQTAVAGGYELLEYGGELAGDLLKRSLDGLILGVVEMLDEFLDGLLRGVELLPALQELLALRGEVVVLVKGFLVDVLVLLESLVDFAKSCLDLFLLG